MFPQSTTTKRARSNLQLVSFLEPLSASIRNEKKKKIVGYSDIQYWRSINPMCAYQAMVCLIIQNRIQTLVNFLGGWFECCQRSRMFLDIWCQWCFQSHLEIHINDFMRKGWKLIAEANGVNSRFLQIKKKSVQLVALACETRNQSD